MIHTSLQGFFTHVTIFSLKQRQQRQATLTVAVQLKIQGKEIDNERDGQLQ